MRWHDARIAATLEEKLIRLICDNLGVSHLGVTHSSTLEADLRADSLAMVELVMELEEELGITVADEDAQLMKTVGDILDYVYRHAPSHGRK
jgi:acyl carrier protein